MKSFVTYAFSILLILTGINACKTFDQKDLAAGIWRGTLKTESGVEIPFNFQVIDSAGKKRIDIINGKDHFRVDDVSIIDDSLHIQIPLFDSEIKASIHKNALTGKWIKHLSNRDASMEFEAQPNASWRFFKADISSRYNLTGRWSSTFIADDGTDTTVAIAEFKQVGSNVSGTFLTTTGDYRFLEGTVSDRKLYLSGFDGSNAYLFTGKLKNDSIITDGKFYSGYSEMDNWTAKKDERAMLPDAYSLTSLKPGIKKIAFSFPDLNNVKVSLSDDKFKNKVVVLQFFGSWCPNCMDETAYLSSFYKKYKDRGVEVIGLAYERTADFEHSKRNVQGMRDRLDVKYQLLLTGYINKKPEVVKSLPMLRNFMAFPTTIIIDKNGFVHKIHTGFSGPGTGHHYEEFISEFEQTINDLLAEELNP